MARGQKYSDEIKEQAYLLYATCGNYNEVSRQLDVPFSTVKGWIDRKEPDEFDKLRNQKKQEFVDKASELIDLALDRLKSELNDDKNHIPVNQLTTAIGTLYDKRALARGESTGNTVVEIKLPDGADAYAK